VRNTVGVLTDDAFTQTNPPIITAPATTVSDNVDTSVLGVLSGSVCFTRPDEGPNSIGGPETAAGAPTALQATLIRPLGLFINTAVGNSFENTPGPASGKGPYVSSQGTYASQLFETQALAAVGAYAQGADMTYTTGMELAASDNGYLAPRVDSAGADMSTTADFFLEATNSAVSGTTTIGVLKMPSDSEQAEIVFDQRI
jgi:hypothetical protein